MDVAEHIAIVSKEGKLLSEAAERNGLDVHIPDLPPEAIPGIILVRPPPGWSA